MRSLPIACTLGPEDYSKRLAWIGRLNRGSLRSYRSDDVTLELTYDIAANNEVRELIQREEKCCAFLHFTVAESPETIRLRIEAPPEALDSTDTLFAPFLEGIRG